MAAAKYNKPAPNLTPVILLVTAVLAVAAVLVDLPVGVVVWLGVAVTAIAYPAPVMTGTKGVAANEHEERQQEKYRSWLQTRAAMFLGNGVGWRTFMPSAPGNASEAVREIRQAISQARQAGLPAWKLVIIAAAGSIAPILRALMPRLAYLPALGLGLIAAALPLSGDAIERAVLAATELNDAPQAISVPMPWWIHLVSGALLAHTVLVLSARKQVLSSEPEVGLASPGELWADRRGLFWLVVPVAALGVWLGAEGLSALWDGLPRISTALAGAGGGLLALYALLAKTSRDLGLAQWRKVQAAKNEWEPRFSSALKIKDGDTKAMPRIVDRTEIETENGTVTVDTVDSPAGLLVDGMVKNSPALEASLGGGHSLTVLSSPNVDSKRQPVPGTKHPVRVRLVTWPDGTHPNLLDVNLPEELVRIAHECDMTDAMDSIGYARPILLELQQVAVMPEKVAPEDAENEPDDEAETDETDETDESAEPARKKGGALKRIGRFLTGAPEPEPVYPASAPCAVWMTTWAFPEGPSYEALRAESESVVKMASRGSDGVDVVVDHRKGFVLIGDPVADDVEYIPESGLELEYVQQRLTEKVWERRWETTLQQNANPPTVRFEVTRDAELPSRFGGGAVIHEQLFACREGLSASETYIDPVRPLEGFMAASMSGASMVSIVGWPATPRQYGTRHSLLFLVRWAEKPVPERPQEVVPAERPRGIDTDASVWLIAHLVNQSFIAKAVKLPKPEVSAAECLTVPSSPKHVWKVKLSLYGATTLADIRKKADSIQAQLGAPWLRVREDEDGEVWLYMGDPSSSAKFRRGGENEIANLDFEQAWLDSSVKNRSGRTPQLVKMEPLKTNPDISVLDFSFPPGLDFQRVKSAREQLRANFRAEFVDVVPIGSTGVKMFMAKEDPLPKMAGVPWDDLPSTNIAFGVNALGEQVFFDIEDSPHLLILGSSGSGKAQPLTARIPVPISERFPDGWALLGDLVPGDQVFDGADGSVRTIESLSEDIEDEVFVVTTSDGQKHEASSRHLWEVRTFEDRQSLAHFAARRPDGRTEHESENLAESIRLRSLAAQTAYGSFGSLAQIADVADVPVERLYTAGIQLSATRERTRVATRKTITEVPVAEFAAWLGEKGRTFDRRRITAESFAGLSGTMSVRQLTEAAIGTGARDKQRCMRRLVAESGLGIGSGGYEVREVDLYPVEETIARLADWYEDRGTAPAPRTERRIVTTAQLRELVESATHAVSVDLAGIDGEETDLPIAPYTLGAWLGDGTSRYAQITSIDEGILDRIREDGHEVESLKSSSVEFAIRGLHRELRLAGLLRNKHIPAQYLRASRAQRLALVQGLMDTDGHVTADGSCEITMADHDLLEQVRELLRSLGVRVGPVYSSDNHYVRDGERRDGFEKHRITFTTSLPVFHLARKAERLPVETGRTEGRVYVRSVEPTGRTETMRCLRVASEKHTYLTGEFTPTHNSVTMRTILFGALLNGFDVVVIDPTKNGLDFAFAKPWSIAPFGEDVYGAASIIRAVYGEVEKRKALNSQYGATKIDELPAEVRPHRIMVMIDEFTSLLGSSPVPPKSDDPEVAAARDEVIAENGARAQVGTMAGKIAREARSVGVHLVLGTQKLTAKTLDTIPGAGDLRALALDTRIPVPVSDRFPEGWAVNAELEVGDKVYAKGGDIASVVKLTETFEDRDTYRIRFDDGQEFVVDAGHLWNASDEVSRKAHHSGRAVKVNRVKSAVLPRLREIAEKTPYGTVATAEELSEMSGIALTKAKKIIRDLSIPSFVASTDRSMTVPAPVKVGTTPRLFPTREASELYGVDMQSLGEFATSRAVAEFVLGSSSKSDGGVFGTRMLSHGISPLDVDDRRMFDVQEFAHRAADFLENESKDYSFPLYRTVTTEEMHENPGRWAVALSPILGEEAHLPVDPYVLGAWLGDGSTGTGIISSATVPACTSADGITDQQRMIDHLTEAGFEGHALECSPVFVGTRGLKVKLREAGVLDRKHIPAEYLRASYDQRLALLQGLMDTDGSVNANGRCIITQAREYLALEILELVRSLGWDAHYWYGYYGGSHRYQVGFKADRPVFRLPRKVEKQDLSERTPYRMIESIEKIDSTPVRCIGIDHPSHEFLVGEFVPTHNTNLARMALGSTTQGDRMSAFRNPMESDDIGEPRKGRGLYEGLNYVKPTVFHSWYAPERDFPAQLEAVGIGKPTEDRIIDPEDRRFKVAPPEPFVEIEAEDDAPTIEDDVVELDLDLGLDDLDLGDLDLDLDVESEGTDSADADEPESPGDTEPARVVASQMEGESAYEKIDALGGALLDGKEVSALVWDEGGLDEPTEMGATVGELLDELRSDHGIDIEIVGGETEPELDDADPEPEPETDPDPELDDADLEPETELEIDSGDPESTDEPESSLDFEAPPATEISDSFSFEPELGESDDDDFGFEAPVIIR